MKISRLIIVDGNAPWVRSLFLAMPAEIDVRFLRVGQPNVFRKLSDMPWLTARRWQNLSGDESSRLATARRAVLNADLTRETRPSRSSLNEELHQPHAAERWIVIPGWGKAPAISSWLVQRAIRSATDDPATTAVIFTLPFYAAAAERTQAGRRIYYAHDPFEFYGWDKDRTRELENRMLKACDRTFAISRMLRDDLLARTFRPVDFSPNAVSEEFVAAMQASDGAVPPDLANIPRPMVGCTGQINETYDWPMLGELAAAMPNVSFVFIGPIIAEIAEQRRAIESVLKGRANVHWLGPKPHEDLPDYLRAFDVCLNPLAAGPHADRRSPLRLYDFLATGKPVVSTAVAEAESHEAQVRIGQNGFEIAQLIRAALSGEKPVNLSDRLEYLHRNTWSARARKLLEKIAV